MNGIVLCTETTSIISIQIHLILTFSATSGLNIFEYSFSDSLVLTLCCNTWLSDSQSSLYYEVVLLLYFVLLRNVRPFRSLFILTCVNFQNLYYFA